MGFHFLDGVLRSNKVLILRKPNVSIFFVACAFGVMFKKALPNQGVRNLLLYFLLRVLILLAFLHFQFFFITKKIFFKFISRETETAQVG